MTDWDALERASALEEERTRILVAAGARPRPARVRLAGYWNAWFSWPEIFQARALAETGSEEECQAELDRLDTVRDHRLSAWRWSQ